MNKIIPIVYMVCGVCLLSIMTGCGSTGTSGGSTSYYHGSSWGYDTYYRSDVDVHYNGQVARDRVDHYGGGGARSGGGGRGGGGRR